MKTTNALTKWPACGRTLKFLAM